MPEENNQFDFAEQEKKLSKERINKAKQKMRNRFRKPEDDPVTYLEGLLHQEGIQPHSIAAHQFLKNKTRQ